MKYYYKKQFIILWSLLLNRLEKYEKMVRKFYHMAGLREDWLTEMENLSERLQKTPGSQLGAARKAEALRMEIESKEKRFRELENLAHEIEKYHEYKQGAAVQQLNAKIQSRWATLSGPKMRSLLARLAFPQTRADMMEQLDVMNNKIKELEVSFFNTSPHGIKTFFVFIGIVV